MDKPMFTRLLAAVLTAMLIFILTACGEKKPAMQPSAGEALSLSDTDYSDMKNWLSFGGDGSRDVDVFAVYPTIAQSMDEADRPYVRLDSEMMRKMAEVWMLEVDGVIADTANIYAPFYRQLNGVELSSLTSDALESHTCATPRDDVFAAFDHFLTNVNKGERPFILYGRSQGAQLVLELATTFLGNEKYAEHNKNHIATYAIGSSVTQNHIDRNPNLKFCESGEDTGVIISWNTTAPSEVASEAYKNFGTWKDGAYVINPLTWSTDETPAPATPFAGMLPGQDGISPVSGSADAAVDKERGILVVSTVDERQFPARSDVLSRFHSCDVLFFTDSIRQNVSDRIAAFCSG